MPFISITVTGAAPTAAQKQRLYSETTRLMNEVMRKKAELTAVRLEEAGQEGWSIGGRSLAERGERAAHMDITVTLGTNTEQEKAGMIRQAMAMLKETLGPLAEASYVVIHELDAKSWGYDGATQYARSKR